MMEGSAVKNKVFSCPSKVLIMGGYAILSEECVGLTVGLNERFYVYVETVKVPEKEQNSGDVQDSFGSIRFVSAQIESEWEYTIHNEGKKHVDCSKESNPFLDSVVSVIVSEGLIKEAFGCIKVHIFHDNRFYSRLSQRDLKDTRRFRVFDKKQLHKTGLGSSACVLVACIGSLLDRVAGVTDLAVIHRLAQKANFVAQKKIGSGFDVATSVFGSQVYSRFPPSIFSLEDQLLVHDWGKFNRFHIPKELKVVMIDLQIGSDTRVLAGGVKKYLDANPQEAQAFFEANNAHAHELQEIFKRISSKEELNVEREAIVKINRSYRVVFKKIGVDSGIETEPDVLSGMLDKIVDSLEKVYYAVCPGAGGFDAICLLVDSSMDLEEIDRFTQKILAEQTQISSMTREVIDASLEGFRELSNEESLLFFDAIIAQQEE